MGMKKIEIDEAIFRRMWAAGASRTDLACHFDCSVSTVDEVRVRMGLPARNRYRYQNKQVTLDPTPDEIVERARECREKHYAQRRGEADETTRVRLWRNGGAA